MGEHVGGGFTPGHELAVVPDEAVAIGHRHGVLLGWKGSAFAPCNGRL
jgi:hypothetical protein